MSTIRSGMRALVALIAGTSVAVVLFLTMNALITGADDKRGSAPGGQIVDLVRVQDDKFLQTRERVRPKKPPPPKNPPPPPKLADLSENEPPPSPLQMDIPRIQLTTTGGDGAFLGTWTPGDVAEEGDAVPIVRFDPQWPHEALMNGIEGFVRVELLIDVEGGVKDVKVIDASPGRVFVRNTLRAVRRWKFKPRIVDGQPVERLATTSIVFDLEDD